MKKVLRLGVITLVLLLLLTSCMEQQQEQMAPQEETKQIQTVNTEIEGSPELKRRVAETEEKLDWTFDIIEAEEYEIIDIIAKSTPETGVKGMIERPREYYDFISFCYEKDNNIVFKTLATDNDSEYNQYAVYCDIGLENRLIIVYAAETIGQTKTIYYITLTKETYQTIYSP